MDSSVLIILVCSLWDFPDFFRDLDAQITTRNRGDYRLQRSEIAERQRNRNQSASKSVATRKEIATEIAVIRNRRDFKFSRFVLFLLLGL